ncbi:MAG: amidohydrolase family protein [Deltaproteobacteria bacterium]|nr:amidohydrolase family protein [Deltaproteobacteria bacterium]
MERFDGLLFDCDNHYYEAEDAFTRHVPKRMQKRCVQWVEMGGRRHHLVAGKLNHAVGNPTFNPVSKPGVLREYYHGNPDGKTFIELTHSALEPMPPEYMDRDVRVERIKEQGLEGAWLFPTAGILYEQALAHDTDALSATCEGFNRWLEEDWGFAYQEKLFAAPYISLADVDWACREIEWALERDVRVIVMRPSAVQTRDGWRSPADPEFDPFWARVNEAGISVVAHVGSNAYTTNGYGRNTALAILGGGRKPSVAGLIPERAIYDFLLTLTYEKLFERFPNLRVASIENGSGFLGDLFVKIDQSKHRMPNYYKEDPAELFREHVWINPFWEDKISDVVSHMGADRVIFGSDWPHMEGMEQPRDIFEELDGISLADQQKILHDNTAALNQPRPTWR